MWIGPPRDVPCRVHARGARLEILVDGDPSIELETRFLGELQTWSNADAYNHQLGFDRATFLQADVFFVDSSGFVFQVKDNAMLLMKGADKVTHFRAENALHRPPIRRHDVNL